MGIRSVRATAQCTVLIVGVLLDGASADETGRTTPTGVPSRSEWLQAPSIQGDVTAQDAKARRELLKWLDDDQSDDFRHAYKTTIPDVPTGLPDDYDVAIYGSYIGSLRCLIQVRQGKATGEYQATGGMRRRGKLSFELIDTRVRQLAYATRARYEPRVPDAPPVGTTSGSGCTHAPFLRIHVASILADQPWRLTTDARQLCGGQIDFPTNGLRGYCHQRLIGDILDASARWRDVTVESRLSAETLQDLRDLVDRVKKLGPLAGQLQRAKERGAEIVRPHDLDVDGLERAFIDGRILAFRAIDARIRDAAPLLEQVGQSARAAHVRLVTSQDASAVRKALQSSDPETERTALKAAVALPAPIGAELLLETLPKWEFRWHEQLTALENVPLQERHFAFLRESRQAPDTHPEFRFDLAGLALFKADDESAYRTLRSVASTQEEFSPAEFDLVTQRTLLTIFDTAERTGRRQEDAAMLARTWLNRTSSQPERFEHCDWLARALGFFGRADDARRLSELAERSKGPWRIAAIQGLAALEPKPALEMAREDFRRLLAQSSDELNSDESFDEYLDLFFWRRDSSIIAQIQLLLDDRKPATPKLEPWRRRRVELLVNYVRERDLEERIDWAFAYLRNVSPRQMWPRKVVAQLLTEGADPEACRVLGTLVDRRWVK